MLDHLAILIIGKQNAGKTTTLKHFCDTYNYQTVSTFKEGWRNGLSPFKPKYNGVKIIGYFLPASRSERHTHIKENLDDLEWTPDFLFMAEQLHGDQYSNTINYLRRKDFHIKEFLLDNSNPDTIWHFYDKKDEVAIQMHRTEQIADYVRAFINART